MSARHAATLPDGGAEDHDRLAPAVWNPVGNAVVAAADILVGERVLDVFAATGTGTIPAAQLTGPDGRVDAVDRSPAMLDLAEAKAEALALNGVFFHRVDPAEWTPDAPYDAVVSCYGVLLLEDLDAGMDRIVGLLRPGGRIALSTWDDGALERFGGILLDVLREVLPSGTDEDGADGIHGLEASGRSSGTAFVENCRRLASVELLTDWLHARGLTNVRVEQFGLTVPLDPDGAWSLVLGSGFRGLLPDDPEILLRVRSVFAERLGDAFVLDADSLIAVADYRPAQ
ncbi:class I SAM-dependent methyltransferase [Arthrobacter sp. SX1312]|uniref:class I SAM-dependent methyltransferase n=1 Tax=Arthrobacter sp. SX1312 TaxID=2058896 RepID=UPI000CE51B5D|nr:class I SAM-dependent methyltransferase [Arthrobacter sp. SX1312]